MFEVIAEHGQVLLILACIFGFFMAWGIGANDVANAMGTSVGARALTVAQLQPSGKELSMQQSLAKHPNCLFLACWLLY